MLLSPITATANCHHPCVLFSISEDWASSEMLYVLINQLALNVTQGSLLSLLVQINMINPLVVITL